jgi:hypothetical protein
MTTYEDFCTKQRERADAHLAEFLRGNLDCSVDQGHPQWQKGTHLVTFGSYRGRPAVFKYYDGDPRKEHEKRALKLYAPIGLAPEVFAETDVMLVMQRLPGATMDEVLKDLAPPARDELFFSLGEVVAKVAQAMPGREEASRTDASFRACDFTDFYKTSHDDLLALYRQASTATFFDTTLARAERVVSERQVPLRATLKDSLGLLRLAQDAILAYPSFVHMDDFHANNIMAEGPRVTGFIDLEMTRSGNEPLLLGIALASLCPRPEAWPAFRRGYEHGRGTPLSDSLLLLARIAAPFSAWTRFTWYWSIDDQPWWAREMHLHKSAVIEVLEALEVVERTKL